MFVLNSHGVFAGWAFPSKVIHSFLDQMGTVIPMKYNNDRGQGVKDGVFQNLPNLKKIWRERDIYASCSNSNIEEFVPPENSGTAITEVSLDCK